MNHIFILFHIVAFTAGIGSLAFACFFYFRQRGPLLKNVLLADIFFTLTMVLDSTDLYMRKNISGYPQIIHQIFFLTIYVLGVLVCYFLASLVHLVTQRPFHPVKKRLFFIFIFFILCIALYFEYAYKHFILMKSWTAAFLYLASIVFYCYCSVRLWLGRISIRREHQPYAAASMTAAAIVLPYSLITSITDALPSFAYKLPLTPLVYLFISTLLLLYVKETILVKNFVAGPGLNEDEFVKKFGITERELDIIRLIIDGQSNQDIGSKLFISPNTVKNHVYNIYKKIGIKKRFELMSLLSKEGTETK